MMGIKRCQLCRKYEGHYHVSGELGEFVLVCANCLTPEQKENIDRARNHEDICGVEGCGGDGYELDYVLGYWLCETHAGGHHG